MYTTPLDCHWYLLFTLHYIIYFWSLDNNWGEPHTNDSYI